MLLILRKSLKSLQNVLNEFFSILDNNLTIATASAFSQARKNLSHKIFIELNKSCIIEEYYIEIHKTFREFRVLAIDGSRFILPNNKKIKDEFGLIKTSNQLGKHRDYASGLVSVIYDVLNNIVLDSSINNCHSYETDLAIEHLKHTKEKDLVITDRGYTSYNWLSHCYKNKVDFVSRCSRSSFKEARNMFKNNEISKIVTLKRPKPSRSRSLDLPKEIQVRFVKVILDNGEIEILATSLLDEKEYSNDVFKDLYWFRWGVETYYDLIKNRLNIENFTGKSVEAVKQDFYSIVFLSNLESIFTKEAEKELEKKSFSNKNKQKVNKSISFNTMKNNIIELLLNNNDLDKLLIKMDKLFLQTPTQVRGNRQFEREKKKPQRALNYLKRVRKILF